MDLLNRVLAAEEFVQNAEQFYDELHMTWREDIAAYYRDGLERKKDLIQYEWHRINKLGMQIALEQGRSIEEALDL